MFLTAQNSAIRYIRLHASANIACKYLNLNEDFPVCDFTMLQNVTLFRPCPGEHCQICGPVSVYVPSMLISGNQVILKVTCLISTGHW